MTLASAILLAHQSVFPIACKHNDVPCIHVWDAYNITQIRLNFQNYPSTWCVDIFLDFLFKCISPSQVYVCNNVHNWIHRKGNVFFISTILRRLETLLVIARVTKPKLIILSFIFNISPQFLSCHVYKCLPLRNKKIYIEKTNHII